MQLSGKKRILKIGRQTKELWPVIAELSKKNFENRFTNKEVRDLLESVLEFHGHVAVDLGFLHDLADEPLLAVQVVVVELLIHVLEHRDPLNDVHSLVVVSVIVGPVNFAENLDYRLIFYSYMLLLPFTIF